MATGEAAEGQPYKKKSRELSSAEETEQKLRMDCLYRLFAEADKQKISQPGYCTLSRLSFDRIFNCLMRRHDLTGRLHAKGLCPTYAGQ